MKSNRGRGGIVEHILIEDVTMTGISREAFTVNTGYNGASDGPAPLFRKITLKNICADNVKMPIYLVGLPDMNLEEIRVSDSSFTRCSAEAKIEHATKLVFENVTIHRKDRAAVPLKLKKVSDSTFTGMDLNRDMIKKDCVDIRLKITSP